MPIKRCSSQSSQGRVTLTDSYAEFIRIRDKSGGTNDHMSKAGKDMIRFIEMINDNFEETQLWGLTSHARLIIQKEDKENKEESAWYVIVAPGGYGSYGIQYLLPKTKRPWKNAYVSGNAENLEEAKKYLIIAMNECEGWKENQELKDLVKKLEE